MALFSQVMLAVYILVTLLLLLVHSSVFFMLLQEDALGCSEEEGRQY